MGKEFCLEVRSNIGKAELLEYYISSDKRMRSRLQKALEKVHQADQYKEDASDVLTQIDCLKNEKDSVQQVRINTLFSLLDVEPIYEELSENERIQNYIDHLGSGVNS